MASEWCQDPFFFVKKGPDTFFVGESRAPAPNRSTYRDKPSAFSQANQARLYLAEG
jgi:hypothetical protein